MLQYGIDKRTEDLQGLFEQALYGGTRLSKTLKQSVYLKNVFALDYFKKYDIVPKNNDNVSYINNRDEEEAVDKDIATELYSDGLQKSRSAAALSFGSKTLSGSHRW